jgi:asparagine synthase (glutamine-hydrolysing)
MISDVNVGAYLSGGVDSTSIVESMTRQSNKQIKTFTVGFGWEGDELDQARKTASLLGTDHYEIECTSTHLDRLPEIIWKCDEPLGDPIVIPSFLLAEEAKRHVTVALSGEGADELFGGYAFHKVLLGVTQYKKICPKFLHRFLMSPSFSAIPTRFLNLLFNYPAYLGQSGKNKIVDYVRRVQDRSAHDNFYDLINLFSEREGKEIYTPSFHDQQQTQLATAYAVQLQSPTLQDFIGMQFDHWLPDNMLMRQDKVSMANGLEVRVPFLDNKMIDYSYSISSSMKIGRGMNKRVVREALQQRLKNYDSETKKTPFYFPFENMYNSKEFNSLIDRCLTEEVLHKRGYFRPREIHILLSQMRNRNFLAAKQIFSIISLELWHQMYFDA